MRKLLIASFLLIGLQNFAQTWSDNVAQIVYDKCTKCHRPGGIAPTSLMTYDEVSPMAAAIYDAVNDEHMPPWPPDNNYQQYTHDRSLTASQKTTILDWIDAGYPEGNSANTPPPPVYTSTTVLGNGDLTVQMPTYMSKATGMNDDYACFSVPSGLLENRVIKSIEIVPGNRQIVHHALIFMDASGAESTDSTNGDCAGPSNPGTKLMAGYTPGSTPMTLPAADPLKLGINFPANADIYFAMHYPAGSYGQFDSTKVIFHFYPTGTTGIRQVSADPIIQNWSFSLPANQVTNVSAQYPSSGTLSSNISLLSVFPHMHLLGTTIKTYALNSGGDTIKLANIPHWDFHWQDFYFFKNIQVAPVGGKIKANGTYDNTTANEHNPNSPPQTVYAGLNTSDEMFLVYFHYTAYQAGDETYDMESLMSASLEEQMIEDESPVSIFPNPFTEETTINLDAVKTGDVVSLYIYDYQGKLIQRVMNAETMSKDGLSVNWNGKNTLGNDCRNGVYFVSINVNGQNFVKQLVKQ